MYFVRRVLTLGQRRKLWAVTAALLGLSASGALAGDDWLITRINGRWTWEKSGPEGRVHKRFLNQEVLRLTAGGEVEAVSLQSIQPGKVVQCAESARRDPQDGCSSAFLTCQKTGGGATSSFLGLVTNGLKGLSDARNAYRCSVNEDALLNAANEVGLIDGIPPKPTEAPPSSPNTAPAVNGSLYGPS